MPQEQPTATQQPTPPRRYIGDGVYIQIDAGLVWLSTERFERHPTQDQIALGPDELKALGAYVAFADHMLALEVAQHMLTIATQRVGDENKATLQEIGAALEQIARAR
jgi:hypothetical protein